ncbi:hypothetical protein PEL8287_02868 [Roseovarius litorisediminis]|uniref:Phasin domain-containing protein n=1 Tax=Roseovarius litorisediminis TaxID=1312363 RepID=A0A1Y5T6Y6_9RHOB|nr:phasin family protein [Roseovarius litorisediminis]SLN53939.1 hypothetical protein PEL8287_02868 [Roseovarius litorisediminis]
MTKEKQVPSVLPELLKMAGTPLALNPLVKPQVEQFWDAQEKLLQEAEAFTRHWFARRHEATKSAMDAAKKATVSANDPTEAMQAMADWQRHSVERIAEDAGEWMDMVARCTGHVVRSEAQVSEEALEEAVRQTKSATKSKSATPV